MWNGCSAAEHTSRGAARNGIQHWSDRLVLRGVLVDLPAHFGVDGLDPGCPITVDDLEQALSAQGSTVRPGDALLVRTGQLTARRGTWVRPARTGRLRPVRWRGGPGSPWS
ncbi:cyclase family protein [Streptomyces sp. NPDC050508]|uniref:cyclase family protein n=1 Tax=Streptomyces sp. NPDC050508 TaxID=3155405 RepID=UPI0034225DC5